MPRRFPLRSALAVLGTALACRSDRSSPLVTRGTVEVPEIDLAAAVPARVIAIKYQEGAAVAAGDTVVRMSQADLPASIDAQRARVRMSESELSDLEAGARPEELRRAEAELAATRAEAERTAKDAERIRSLAARDVVSRQQLDQAETAARVAAAQQRSAEQALDLLKAGARSDRLRVARSDVANAKAALGAVEARANDLLLISPVAGRILTRQAEPGELLAAGIPAVTIGETGRPYVRVFLPASRVAEVALGDTVAIVPEGDPGAAGQGVVVAINAKAEFTPRVALTEEERADLMFGIKVELRPPFERFHPGLWVRATFTPSRRPSPAPAQ